MKEDCESLRADDAEDPRSIILSMEHGTISPDGKLIAVGHQDSLHYVFDAQSLKIVGEIGNMSEYPHYAAFSADGSMIAFNSCHFYYGETIGLPTNLLPGIKTDRYQLDKRLVNLEVGSRVYAAVSRGDEFIIGDACRIPVYSGSRCQRSRSFCDRDGDSSRKSQMVVLEERGEAIDLVR